MYMTISYVFVSVEVFPYSKAHGLLNVDMLIRTMTMEIEFDS